MEGDQPAKGKRRNPQRRETKLKERRVQGGTLGLRLQGGVWPGCGSEVGELGQRVRARLPRGAV